MRLKDRLIILLFFSVSFALVANAQPPNSCAKAGIDMGVNIPGTMAVLTPESNTSPKPKTQPESPEIPGTGGEVELSSNGTVTVKHTSGSTTTTGGASNTSHSTNPTKPNVITVDSITGNMRASGGSATVQQMFFRKVSPPTRPGGGSAVCSKKKGDQCEETKDCPKGQVCSSKCKCIGLAAGPGPGTGPGTGTGGTTKTGTAPADPRGQVDFEALSGRDYNSEDDKEDFIMEGSSQNPTFESEDISLNERSDVFPAVREFPVDGFWLRTERPLAYWYLNSDYLIAFYKEGDRAIYEHRDGNSFRLLAYRGAYDNEDRYFYDESSGRLKELRSGGVKTEYTVNSTSTSEIVRKKLSLCKESYSNCIPRPELDTELHYNAQGLLIKEVGQIQEYLLPPEKEGELLDPANALVHKPTVDYSYSPEGLLQKVEYSIGGYHEVLHSFSWKQDAGTGEWYLNEIDKGGIKTTISYRVLPVGEREVLLSSPGLLRRYHFDDNDNISSVSFEDTFYQQQPQSSLEWNMEYDLGGGCNFLSRIEYPNGNFWTGEWDPYTGQLLRERTPDSDGESEALTTYEYGNWFDAVLKSISDKYNNKTESSYTFEKREDLVENYIPDPGFKVLKQKLFSPVVTLQDSRKVVYQSFEERAHDGRLIATRDESGLVQELIYAEEELSKPLVNTLVGVAQSSDPSRVDRADRETVSSRVSYNKNGKVNLMFQGEPGNEEPRRQLLYNSAGKVSRITDFVRHSQSQPQISEFYYNEKGELTLKRYLNRDSSASRPKTVDGAPNGADWRIVQWVGDGNSAWSLRSIGPSYAASVAKGFDPNFYQFSKSSYDPATGILMRGDQFIHQLTYLDGLGRPQIVKDDRGTVLERYNYEYDRYTAHFLVAEDRSSKQLHYYSSTTYLNSYGLPYAVEDSKGSKVLISESSADRTRSITKLIGETEVFTLYQHFDEIGRMVEEDYVNYFKEDKPQSTAKYYYSPSGRLSSAELDNKLVQYEYSPAGFLTLLAEGKQLTELVRYPNSDLVHKEKNCLADICISNSYNYDALGQAVQLLSEDSEGNKVNYHWYYDSLGVVDKQISGAELVESSRGGEWQKWDNFTLERRSNIDAQSGDQTLQEFINGKLYAISIYDKYGQKKSYERIGSGKKKFSYDLAYNLIAESLPNATVASFAYDSNGRRVKSTLRRNEEPAQSQEVLFNAFDNIEKIIASSDSLRVEEVLTWKTPLELGSVTSKYPGYPDRKVAWQVVNDKGVPDSAGASIDMQLDNLLSWRHRFSKDEGRIDSAGFGPNKFSLPQTTVSYVDNKSIQYANGIKEVSSYDTQGRLESIFHLAKDNNLIGGELLSWSEGDFLESVARIGPKGFGDVFDYERDMPLKAKLGVAGFADVFAGYLNATLHSNGEQVEIETEKDTPLRKSRTTTDANGTRTDVYTIDNANQRHSAFNQFAILYNEQGDTIKDQRYSYDYDLSGRLISVSDSQGIRARYRYDAGGRLAIIEELRTGKQKRLIYNGWSVIAEEDEEGIRKIYQWDINGPIDRLLFTWDRDAKDGTHSYITHGHLSPASSFDESGKRKSYFTYSFDGVPVEYDAEGSVKTGVSQATQFHGAYYDEVTGLYYMRNRWYDPQRGAFLSRDSIFDPAVPDGYGYVANQPNMVRDPYALQYARWISHHELRLSDGEFTLVEISKDVDGKTFEKTVTEGSTDQLMLPPAAMKAQNSTVTLPAKSPFKSARYEALFKYLEYNMEGAKTVKQIFDYHKKQCQLNSGPSQRAYTYHDAISNYYLAMAEYRRQQYFAGIARWQALFETSITLMALGGGPSRNKDLKNTLNQLRQNSIRFQQDACRYLKTAKEIRSYDCPPQIITTPKREGASCKPRRGRVPTQARIADIAGGEVTQLRDPGAVSIDPNANTSKGQICAKAQKIPCPNNSFDGVFCANIHISGMGSAKAPKEVGSEAIRILKEGKSIEIIGNPAANCTIRNLVKFLECHNGLRVDVSGVPVPSKYNFYQFRYSDGNLMPAEALRKLLYWRFIKISS